MGGDCGRNGYCGYTAYSLYVVSRYCGYTAYSLYVVSGYCGYTAYSLYGVSGYCGYTAYILYGVSGYCGYTAYSLYGVSGRIVSPVNGVVKYDYNIPSMSVVSRVVSIITSYHGIRLSTVLFCLYVMKIYLYFLPKK